MRLLAVLYYFFGYCTCISLYMTKIHFLQFASLTFFCYLTFQLREVFNFNQHEDY